MSESTAPLAMEAKSEPKGAAPARKLAVVDWIAVVLAGNAAVFLLGFSFVASRRFGPMFDDFGGRVPLLTSLVVRWYVPTLAGLVVASILVAGLRAKAKRTVFLGIAAALGVICVVTCVYGLYAPIFALADQIKAQ